MVYNGRRRWSEGLNEERPLVKDVNNLSYPRADLEH
jgi:hypothetical protein